jgi:hypothetical protein
MFTFPASSFHQHQSKSPIHSRTHTHVFQSRIQHPPRYTEINSWIQKRLQHPTSSSYPSPSDRTFSPTEMDYSSWYASPYPLLRFHSYCIALVIAFPATYILGSAFPPQIVLLLYPRYAPPPPDKDSIRGKAITSDVEEDLQKLLIVEKLRGREGWYETSELRLGDLCNTG